MNELTIAFNTILIKTFLWAFYNFGRVVTYLSRIHPLNRSRTEDDLRGLRRLPRCSLDHGLGFIRTTLIYLHISFPPKSTSYLQDTHCFRNERDDRMKRPDSLQYPPIVHSYLDQYRRDVQPIFRNYEIYQRKMFSHFPASLISRLHKYKHNNSCSNFKFFFRYIIYLYSVILMLE